MTTRIEALEQMLARGQDSSILRFSLGNALLEIDPGRAAAHFARAVELQPDYSAAWKMLGKAYAAAGDAASARAAFERGIEVAISRGDVQAGKEMQVFLKRLNRPPPAH